MNHLPLGPLMVDIAGTELTDPERERLGHPLIGGVILFSRNYADVDQLRRLTADIHGLRHPNLLIAVDHEGGRVQRFRQDFTKLPAMAALGRLWQENPAAAKVMASQVGFVLASELRACGVDYSFTPVLDLDYGPSRVIGDRAFHRDPMVVLELAGALIAGLREAGMGACGKHYPGHGYVVPDSHVELPVDMRSLAAMADDLLPYRSLKLDGIMAAHVIYECIDCNTAVFSNRWISFLRNDIGFDGVVFTDDLSMAGAGVAGGMIQRVEAAHAAGCDMLLVCNAPAAVGEVLDQWRPNSDRTGPQRLEGLLPAARAATWDELKSDARYRAAVTAIDGLRP